MAIFNSRIRIVGGREPSRSSRSDRHISLATTNVTGSEAFTARHPTTQVDSIYVHEEVWVHTDPGDSDEQVSAVRTPVTKCMNANLGAN